MRATPTLRPRVQRIARISLPVADLAGTADFYENALGFTTLRREARSDDEVVVMALGREEIELVRFSPRGAAYPTPRTAADRWFQHFAIAVSNMPAAYAQLLAQLLAQGGAQPISEGGPQLLPPSTGAVTAYKFRDPEGHPLELSFFPQGIGAPQWQAIDSIFLGIDHSGIAVANLDVSVAFYRDVLGFQVAPVLVNSGPTQARLDGLADPVVDIVAVSLPTGPHIELLAYRGPKAPPEPPPRPNDIAATQLILRTRDIEGFSEQLRRSGAAVVSIEHARTGVGGAILVRDPDGHLLRFEAAP